MLKKILNSLNSKAAALLGLASLVVGAYWLLQPAQPASREGLIPLQMPIRDIAAGPTVGRFSAKWEEPHYIGVDFLQPGAAADSFRRITGESVGSRVHPAPPFGIRWKILDGAREAAHGSGADGYRAMFGNTVALGEFTPVPGVAYEIEVRVDSTVSGFMASRPILEVGVKNASAGVGVAFVEGFSRHLHGPVAYALIVIGLIMLAVAMAARRVQRKSGT